MMKKILYRAGAAVERFVRTDIRYVVSGGFWVSLNYFLQIGFGVGATIALANLLPKASLGSYQFIMSVAAVLSMCTLSGLGLAITRAVARGHDGVLRSSVRLKLLWSTGITLSSSLVALYYFINDNTELSIAFLIVGTFAPFIESFKLYENYLYGKEAFRDSVTLGFWRKPLPFITLITTLFFTDHIPTLIFVYFFSNALSYAAVYGAVIRRHQPSYETHAPTVTQSKHLSILRIVTTVTSHIDKIIIWTTLGGVALATYAIAQITTRYSGGLFNTISALVIPKTAQRDLSTLQKTLPRKVALFTLVMAGGSLLYILIAPWIFTWVFPEYEEAIGLSQLMALGFILIPRSVYTQVLIAHDQRTAQYVLGFGTLILHAALLLILIPNYGLWGAGYAYLLTNIIASVATYWFFQRARNGAATH